MHVLLANIANGSFRKYICNVRQQDVHLSRFVNSAGYPHLNVKIGATHAGISVGEDGATHQCNEDIALMRTIPGMTIINPSDDVEAKAAVRAAYELDGPCILEYLDVLQYL